MTLVSTVICLNIIVQLSSIMPYSSEVKVIIKHYRSDKGWKIITYRVSKSWLKKIDQTGSTDCKSGSGRPRSARTNDNTEYVEEEISSQETNLGSPSTPAEISKRLDIFESSVRRIVRNYLKLKPFKKMKGQVLSPLDKQKSVVRVGKLLKQLTFSKLSKTFFSDEKVFKVQDYRNL